MDSVQPRGGGANGDAESQALPLLTTDVGLPQVGKQNQKKKKKRVVSLDAFRGFTVMLMIFVDNAGDYFPSIDHCPWDGVALADFVMPFFDFIVGVSVAIALQRFIRPSGPGRTRGLRKVLWRTFKLFILGMLTQGCKDLFVCDLKRIRTMGILQRVAVCFLVAALIQLYGTQPVNKTDAEAGTHTQVFRYARGHWCGFIVLCVVWIVIMYGIDVAPAYGEICGRGVLTPACNAQRVVDAAILGEDHMYYPSNGGDYAGRGVTFLRMENCSSCSPGLCTAPATAGAWCLEAPFDPEGLVSSLTASADTLVGVHAGHVLLLPLSDSSRLLHWAGMGSCMLVLAFIMHYSGLMLWNTDLYTISFLLLTSGAGLLALAVFYRIADVHVNDTLTKAIQPMVWVGRNAIAVYVLAESGITQWVFGVFYWDKQENNLANILWPGGGFWGLPSSTDHRLAHPSRDAGVMVWTFAYIALWTAFAYVMDRKRIYVKI